MRLDARLQFEKVMHRLAIDGEDLIAGVQTGPGRRAVGLHLPEHRGYRRLVETQAEAVDQR